MFSPAEPGAPGRPAPVPLVGSTRRHVLHPEQPHVVESRHFGHLVVIGPDGERVLALGDPGRLTFARSCAKPFQVTACLEALLDNGVDLPGDDEIAVSWASHRAEPAQLAVVARLLARSGRDATQLTCPPARSPAQPGTVPRRLNCDCSGKHAMFALAGDVVGCAPSRLLDPTGKLQKRVLGVLEAAFGPPGAVSVDGCGAPAVAVPLDRVAHAFRDLATGGRWQRARDAGLAHPGMVGGTGRLETELLQRGYAAKPGAQGLFAVGWNDPRGQPWGLAARVENGSGDAAATAVLAALNAGELVSRDAWTPPEVLGGGEPIGELRATDELVEACQVLRAAR